MKAKKYVITFVEGDGLYAMRNVVDTEEKAKEITATMVKLKAEYHEIKINE